VLNRLIGLVLVVIVVLDRVDHVRFRKIVFALLFVSGLALLLRG
jgi:hypothetical membrane protein